jgi:hypothetical protein
MRKSKTPQHNDLEKRSSDVPNSIGNRHQSIKASSTGELLKSGVH